MAWKPPFKRVFSIWAIALLLLVTGVSPSQFAWAGGKTNAAQVVGPLGLMDVAIDDSGISLQGNRPFTGNETRNFTVLRLPSPYRLLVEIPNTRLLTAQNTFAIGQNGIDRVELSENRSPFYSAVRMTVYVNDSQALSRLTVAFEGAALHIDDPAAVANASKRGEKAQAQPLPPVASAPLPGIAPKNVSAPSPPLPEGLGKTAEAPVTVLGGPLPEGASLIEDIAFRDYKLLLKARSRDTLRVKDRFTLSDPSRLVLDVENAVLASKSLTAPITGTDGVRQIRVGQFNENTVRLVIEADDPERFETIYPGSDRSLLAVTPYSDTSIEKLSATTKPGQIESIDLKRENGNTILRLTASTPIVHRFLKNNDRLTLDLLNEAANPTQIGFDRKQYPEIALMRLEPLTAGQPNSKLSLNLTNAGVRAIASRSGDGRVLEVLLAAAPETAASAAASTGAGTAGTASVISNLGDAGKAPFPARIVVDAGHGGKDDGASRSGVKEKDLNLSLALMVKDALEAKGFKVTMTRTTDEFLPLPTITAITNRIQPDLFISIHHNASVNPGLNGIETYYYTPQSLALARRVHARSINSVAAQDNGVKKAMFYVIHHTNVPAILCEVGYVSNPQELEDLQTWDRKSKTARAIADGVVDYVKSRMSAQAK